MSQVKPDFYTRTSDAWRIMLEDMRSAKHTIDIEQYIFTIDSIGRQFVEVLKEKAHKGVRVRLLCDMAGSYGFYSSNLPEFLRKQGIEVRFFNPIKPWRIRNFTSNFFRDHRKIMIIDGEIAHLGSACIDETMEAWRDTHVRLVGPIVENIKETFQSVWEGYKKGFYIKYKKPHTFVRKYDLDINAPSIRQRYIYHNLLYRIRNAKRYVYLTTPYFIPDVQLYRALRLAARREVEVKIIVPEIADHYFINHARESYFTLALKAGIKIFIYTPTMMHAKTAVVDDFWATAGSFNLDSLSFRFNHEANISSLDPLFVNEIRNHFYDDLKQCREVKYEEWIKRPLRKKFLELLTWPFHGIM